MKPIETLYKDLQVIKALANKIARVSLDVETRYAEIFNDNTRTQLWKGPKLAEIRDAGIQVFSNLWEEVCVRYAELKDEQAAWNIPMLALSLYGVGGLIPGTPQESTVRGQLLTELRMMPVALLRMEAESAADARDWGKLYLCCLSLDEKNATLPTNLDILPIPNIAAADEIFFELEVAYRESELAIFAIRGQRNNLKTIALGLLKQNQAEARRARAESLDLRWDEARKRDEEAPIPEDKGFSLDVKGS